MKMMKMQGDDEKIEDEEEEEGVVVRGNRVVIDTRRPFGSVKEAVALFGERIRAGELNKLKEIHQAAKGSGEVVENQTKAAKEDEKNLLMMMAVESLRQQLEQTKKELYQLKAKGMINKSLLLLEDSDNKPCDHEIEEENVKFIPEKVNDTDDGSQKLTKSPSYNGHDNDSNNSGYHYSEFQRRRSVKFASPPLLIKVITSEGGGDHSNNDQVIMGERNTKPSVSSKKKKKHLLPLMFIGGLFSRNKGSKDRTFKS